jgi:6-phosphogluconolactonase
MRVIAQLPAGTAPGYIALVKDKLYAVSEDHQSEKENTLRAYQFDVDKPALELLGEVSSLGLHPCHIAVSRDGGSLFTTNYSSSSIAQFDLGDDGSIGHGIFFEQFEGSSVNPNRQKRPYPHYINTTIDGRFVLTADLGTDKVMVHGVDERGRMSVNMSQPFLKLPPGSGPRHLEFHPNNRWIYVLNELNSTMSRIAYHQGEFRLMETVSTLPDDFDGTSYSAAVRLHPNGRYLYCSDRGSDSISAFEIDDNGRLTRVQTFGEGIGWVRDFNVSPSGNYIIAGNQKTSRIVLLALTMQGTIEKVLSTLELPNPSCIVFSN